VNPYASCLLVSKRAGRYAIAALAVLVALLVRLGADAALGDRAPFATFFVAVVLTARLAGFGPAVFALGFGYLLSDWFFVPPRGQLSLLQPATADQVGAAIYLFLGFLVTSLFEAMRRSERRAADSALLAVDRENRLRLATSGAGMGMWEQDLRTGEVVTSDEVRRMMGLPASGERQTVQEWLSTVHPDDLPMVHGALDEAIAGRGEYAPEYRVVLPDRQVRWIASRGSIVRDASGHPLRIGGMAFDVTDKRRAEESLNRLAAIVESSDDAIVSKTLDGVVTSWNDAAVRLFGYTADEMIGEHISRLVPAERPDDLRTILSAIRRGDRVHHFETERIRKDGSRIHVSLTVSPIKDAAGRIIGASKIARDVTERKRSEALLRAIEERTRSLLAFNQGVLTNMGEGLYTVDRQGLVTSVNPVAEKLFGWTSAELLGRKMHDVTHYAHPDGTPFPAAECPGLRVLAEGAVLTDHEDVFIRKDGTFFPVIYSAAPIVTDGGTEGLVVVFRDVTQQRHAAAEREELLAVTEQARSAAEAASRAKDEFLSVVSHELRTPLSSMTNWLRVLRKSPATHSERALEGIDRAAQAQSRLVEDLLDVSRIVNGQLRIETRAIDLRRVVAGALEAVRPAADAKRVRIESDLGMLPFVVSGDPDRLLQVVWNLMSNAVKFTPSGGTVDARLAAVDGDVRLTVRDTGIGIDPDFLPYVFERFMQAEPAATRRHGGLGLGLAIVRHLVELHGGTIAVASAGRGQGTTFTVMLPARLDDAATVEPGNGAAPTPREEIRLDGLRVLVIDDDAIACDALRAVLEDRGAQVTTANSGHEARDVLGRAELDIVVSDIRLPDEDGYSLIQHLRSTARDLPAVAVTAYYALEDRGRALAAGYQAHFSKPVEADELVSTIARLAVVPSTN
jgi:PAS domain S-box-containing protein